MRKSECAHQTLICGHQPAVGSSNKPELTPSIGGHLGNFLDISSVITDTLGIYSPPDQPSGLGRGFVFWGPVACLSMIRGGAYAC